MIKNEKQYKITQKKLGGISRRIAELQQDDPTAIANELVLISLKDVEADLAKEIEDYELLRVTKIETLKSRNINELPTLIIEYKIVSGLTQKEFSKLIGMKEQQLQRYEAEGFTSISFKNLLKILDSIGLDVVIQDTPVRKINKADARSIA